MTTQQLHRRVRVLTIGFIVGLVLSGVTAFPLEWELNLLAGWLGATPNSVPQDYSGFLEWIVRVRNALRETNTQYPFMAYGYDWLAFGHLVIATAFVGLLRDPVRNKWLVDWASSRAWRCFPSPSSAARFAAFRSTGSSSTAASAW